MGLGEETMPTYADELRSYAAMLDADFDGHAWDVSKELTRMSRVLAYEHGRREMANETEVLRQALGDLLAVINRDGGHKAATFPSLCEAGKDAEATVLQMFAEPETETKRWNLTR